MPTAPRFSVNVAASADGIGAAADALDRFQADHGLETSAGSPAHVALDEVLSNVVRHGGLGRSEPVIEVTFAVVDGALQLTVTDDGPAFDPLALPEPDLTAPLEARRPGGLGVHLVRRLMDRVEYARRDGRNCLVLTCRTPRPTPGEPGKG